MIQPRDTGGAGAVCADLEALFPGSCATLRTYVQGVARTTQTPVEMAALGVMCVASACVARCARVRAWGDHTEEAPIWGLILSEPGTRKSAVLSELLAPVVSWERDHEGEHARLRAKRSAQEKRVRALEDKAARTEDQQERARLLEQAIESAIEAQKPIGAPEILSSEPTPEALLRLMRDNGGTALVASAEADVVDIVLGRYSGGQKNFGVMLKGHAGDPVRSHRVGTQSLSIDRPRLALCLVVQPASVRTLLSDEQARGRGLIARFAVVAPPDTVGTRDARPEPIDPRDRETWDRTLRALLDEPVPEQPREITLEQTADHLFLRFQRRVERGLYEGEFQQRRDWGSKLCGLVLRCALTLHTIAKHPGTPLGSVSNGYDQISAEIMNAAIAWGRFLSDATAHATALVEKSEAIDERERLVRWIRERDGSATVGSLMAGLRRYRRDSRGARAACDALVDDGLARWESTPRGQRVVLMGTDEPRQPSSADR